MNNRHEFVRQVLLMGYERMEMFNQETRELYIAADTELPMIVLRPNNTVGFERLAYGPPSGKNEYTLTDAMLLLMAMNPENENERQHDDRETADIV